MNKLAIVTGALCAFTLSSCFENLEIPGLNDTETQTSTLIIFTNSI